MNKSMTTNERHDSVIYKDSMKSHLWGALSLELSRSLSDK